MTENLICLGCLLEVPEPELCRKEFVYNNPWEDMGQWVYLCSPACKGKAQDIHYFFCASCEKNIRYWGINPQYRSSASVKDNLWVRIGEEIFCRVCYEKKIGQKAIDAAELETLFDNFQNKFWANFELAQESEAVPEGTSLVVLGIALLILTAQQFRPLHPEHQALLEDLMRVIK